MPSHALQARHAAPALIRTPYGDQASRESASRKLPWVTALAGPVAWMAPAGSVAIGRMKRSKLPLTSIRYAIALPSGAQTGCETVPAWSSDAVLLGAGRGSWLKLAARG